MPYNILQAFSSTGLHAERKHIMRCVATEGRGNRGFLSSLAASPTWYDLSDGPCSTQAYGSRSRRGSSNMLVDSDWGGYVRLCSGRIRGA